MNIRKRPVRPPSSPTPPRSGNACGLLLRPYANAILVESPRVSEMKVGRNELCPCNSGKKFKKCCLGRTSTTIAAPLSWAQRQAILKFAHRVKQGETEENVRKERFGKVRPEIVTEAFGRTLVGVGSKILGSEEGKKWLTFPDFLLDYVAHIFGREWWDDELRRSFLDRHPVMQWRCQIIDHIRKHSKVPGQPTGFNPTNFIAAFNSFAYDVYTVDHNGRLDNFLLQRLRNKAEFEGARHELCAEATCLRAGFTIKHENQKDTKARHAEFVAIHSSTTQQIAVEAKRRRRQASKNADFRFEHLINDAIKKNPSHPLVIFLDTNLPTAVAEDFFGEDDRELSRPMQTIVDRVRENHGGFDPYNMIIFTNHPHSLSSEEGRLPIGFSTSCISMVPSRPPVDPKVLLELQRASLLYYNVPNNLQIAS